MMGNTKSTKPGHIRYDENLLDFLKTYIVGGNTTDIKLFNAINKSSKGKTPYTTLKGAFNNDKFTLNIVKWLFVFVLKRKIENDKELREIILSLNKLLVRLCWEDLSPEDKNEIVEILEHNSEHTFQFSNVNNENVLTVKGKLTNDNTLSYSNQKIILNNIAKEIANLKKRVQYKEVILYKGIYPKNYANIIERLLLRFVGREYIFNKIDNFITSHNRGYYFIKGDPGIGKTSLSARLVNDKGYFYHIIDFQSYGTNTTESFIENICSQLIIKYSLSIKEFPDEFSENGSFLEKVLIEASQKIAKGQKIVIVIDGIDELIEKELTFFSTTNILYLPDKLPSSIYFILTMRNIDDDIQLPNEENQDKLKIDNKSEWNAKDIKNYIEKNIDNENTQEYIRIQNKTHKKFINEITQKVDGNFIYLTYLLDDIGRGNYKDVTLDSIPQGIDAYFERHWKKIKIENAEHWGEALQIIAALTHTFSPISVDLICKAFEIKDVGLVISVIENMRQFLHTTEIAGIEGYRFYHKSVLDFLNKKSEIKTLKRITLNGFANLNSWLLD